MIFVDEQIKREENIKYLGRIIEKLGYPTAAIIEALAQKEKETALSYREFRSKDESDTPHSEEPKHLRNYALLCELWSKIIL